MYPTVKKSCAFRLAADEKVRAALAIRIEILADENCCTSGIHALAKNAQ